MLLEHHGSQKVSQTFRNHNIDQQNDCIFCHCRKIMVNFPFHSLSFAESADKWACEQASISVHELHAAGWSWQKRLCTWRWQWSAIVKFMIIKHEFVRNPLLEIFLCFKYYFLMFFFYLQSCLHHFWMNLKKRNKKVFFVWLTIVRL